MAATLDTVLNANGELARLVTECPESASADSHRGLAVDVHGQIAELSDTDVLNAITDMRQRLEDLARVAWLTTSVMNAPARTAVVGTATQWAQLASWLYDAFVRRRPRMMRLCPRRYSRRLRMEAGTSPFRIEVSEQDRVPRGECRSIVYQSPPADVAVRLQLDSDASTIVRRENWYYADNEPVQSGVTYIPSLVAGDSCVATEKTLGQGGLYSRLEELGYPINRIREEIFARLPTPDEAAGLRIPPGVPVLDVLHTSYDSNCQPFEVTRFIVRSDLAGLEYEMPIEN
jgi:GntR family transcriptional regulator